MADDLTGACDSALPFLAAGMVRVGLWSCFPPGELACAAISTESRDADVAISYARSRQAASELRGDLLFRKLDSLIRGNLLADLQGVLDSTASTCVVAVALPGEGRVTVGGIQRWPGGEADVATLLRPLGSRVELRDASTDEDLDEIARAILARGDLMAAGTAGLAAALARAFGLAAPAAPSPPGCRRPLAVVGSLAAAGQAAYASARGWEVQVLGPGGLPVLDGHDGLVLTGGETAARVLAAAGARFVELLGEALPRAPLALVRGGHLDGMPVVLKAGAFGGEDALHRAMEVLDGSAA